MAKLPTPGSRALLQAAVEQQQPPSAPGSFRPKLRYAHQGGMNPPIIVIHGIAPRRRDRRLPALPREALPQAFELAGTPLRVELRSADNPFEGRHKPLTEKQDAQRRRRKIISKRRYG